MDLRWSYFLFQFSSFLVFPAFLAVNVTEIFPHWSWPFLFQFLCLYSVRWFERFWLRDHLLLWFERRELLAGASFQWFHIWALWVVKDVDVLQFGVICHVSFRALVLWKRVSFHVQERLTQTIREVTGTSSTVICVHEDRNVWRGKGCWILNVFFHTFSQINKPSPERKDVEFPLERVSEDWNGGAGNGLGTLYAFVKVEDLGCAGQYNWKRNPFLRTVSFHLCQKKNRGEKKMLIKRFGHPFIQNIPCWSSTTMYPGLLQGGETRSRLGQIFVTALSF